MPRRIALASGIDFQGWRKAARALAIGDVPPDDVTWTVARHPSELATSAAARFPRTAREEAFAVPRAFVDLAQTAILHFDPDRFALLYRLLWRLRSQHDLLHAPTDPDVARIVAMTKAVRDDENRMHVEVRFRAIESDIRHVAWFAPRHHIVERGAEFFVRRFPAPHWSILTPECCAHWDGELTFTDGTSLIDTPSSEPIEETWRRYRLRDPDRLTLGSEPTPQHHWRTSPNTSLKKAPNPLAAERARDSTAHRKSQADERNLMVRKSTGTSDLFAGQSLAAVRAEARHCRDCPLYKHATQTVFGEGPDDADVMLVGEQPGDKEDLSGEPFVGPAGRMLDKALHDAGVDRLKTYVTNAVKHFKFLQRGKIRLHQKPNGNEIKICRQWFEREKAIIQPKLIVALGATAAQSVLQRATPIGKNRGHLIDHEGDTKVLVTVHPSYLLRVPEPERAREYEKFVGDLKLVARFLARTNSAA